MSKVYEFGPFLTAPHVRREALPYGAPQIISIPEAQIPSPLAPNLPPNTVKRLKESLTGSADGKAFKPGFEKGAEIWEAWKRAWDLWNNHYIEGRVCPTFIKSEYDRIKIMMQAENDRRSRRRPLSGGGSYAVTGGKRSAPPTGQQLVYSREFSLNKPTRVLPIGRIWARHRYRTKKIRVPGGKQVQLNNPDPDVVPTQVSRKVRRLVQQKAGDTVKVFQKVARNQPGTETRTVRENGPWTANLTSWGDLRAQRRAGTLTAPAESETTAEPGLEPLGTRRETRQVNITSKHLDYVDILVEQQPRPLMSWKELADARLNNGIPDSRKRTEESIYEGSRPQVWLPDEYDLVDTGKTETLSDDRMAEVEELESITENVSGNPLRWVDLGKEVILRQWLEIDDPNFKKKKVKRPTSGTRSKSPTPDGSAQGDGPNPPPPVRPRSNALDFDIYGTRNTPRYAEWVADLPARWDAVNPQRLSSTSDLEWLKWRDLMTSEVVRQWENLLKPGAFESPTHSNGNPALEINVLSRNLKQGGDVDMADVLDQEFQDAFFDDEDMVDCYEQRGMGAPGSDVMSEASEDNWSSENDMFEADDGDGGNDNGGYSSSSSKGSGSSSTSIDLRPPRRGSDGSAGGFLPLKNLPEFREPEPTVDGEFPPDWVDNIQNTVWRPRRVGEKTLKIDLDEPWEKITDLEVDGGLDCGRSPYPVNFSIATKLQRCDLTYLPL